MCRPAAITNENGAIDLLEFSMGFLVSFDTLLSILEASFLRRRTHWLRVAFQAPCRLGRARVELSIHCFILLIAHFIVPILIHFVIEHEANESNIQPLID
jgi:hypothetical protein